MECLLRNALESISSDSQHHQFAQPAKRRFSQKSRSSIVFQNLSRFQSHTQNGWMGACRRLPLALLPSKQSAQALLVTNGGSNEYRDRAYRPSESWLEGTDPASPISCRLGRNRHDGDQCARSNHILEIVSGR